METVTRLAGMLTHANLPAFEVGQVHTYGAAADGRTRRSSFALTRAGERYAEVSLEVHGDAATDLALVIASLLAGAEARLADAEQTIANLRHALEQRRREVAGLERKLAEKDSYFHDWLVKWTARYLCPENSRGIQKFSQALRTQKDALTRIDPHQLRDLQSYLRENHPGYRGEYEDPDDE